MLTCLRPTEYQFKEPKLQPKRKFILISKKQKNASPSKTIYVTPEDCKKEYVRYKLGVKVVDHLSWFEKMDQINKIKSDSYWIYHKVLRSSEEDTFENIHHFDQLDWWYSMPPIHQLQLSFLHIFDTRDVYVRVVKYDQQNHIIYKMYTKMCELGYIKYDNYYDWIDEVCCFMKCPFHMYDLSWPVSHDPPMPYEIKMKIDGLHKYYYAEINESLQDQVKKIVIAGQSGETQYEYKIVTDTVTQYVKEVIGDEQSSMMTITYTNGTEKVVQASYKVVKKSQTVVNISTDKNNQIIVDTKNMMHEEYAQIGYKVGRSIDGEHQCIIKLGLLKESRIANDGGSKFRCSTAKVLSIGLCQEIKDHQVMTFCDALAVSSYDPNFLYVLGHTVSVPNFDQNLTSVCVPGIHFFMDVIGAINYMCSSLKIENIEDIKQHTFNQSLEHLIMLHSSIKLIPEAPPKMLEAPPKMLEAPPKMLEAPPKMLEAPPKMLEAPPKMLEAPHVTVATPSTAPEAPKVPSTAPEAPKVPSTAPEAPKVPSTTP
jgi:hypothetical protein